MVRLNLALAAIGIALFACGCATHSPISINSTPNGAGITIINNGRVIQKGTTPFSTALSTVLSVDGGRYTVWIEKAGYAPAICEVAGKPVCLAQVILGMGRGIQVTKRSPEAMWQIDESNRSISVCLVAAKGNAPVFENIPGKQSAPVALPPKDNQNSSW